jgi:hypothetical protein
MPTHSVPKGCTGFDFADGTRVDASKAGKLILTDAQSAAFRKDGNYDFIGSNGYCPPANAHLPANDCPTCGFAAWPWQKDCPKCSTVLA